MPKRPLPSTRPAADAVAVLVAMVLPSLGTWLYYVALSDQAQAVQQAVYLACKMVQFGFPLVWVLSMERRRPQWIGPTRRPLIEGTFFGLTVAAAMLLGYQLWLKPAGLFDAVGQLIHEKLAGFGVDTAAEFVLLGAAYSMVHAFLEEYYYRWFLFGRLRRWLPLSAAIAISAVGFTAHHVIVLAVYFGPTSPVTILFSLAVGVGGAIWAWLYHRGGSLWGPWISHLLIDVAIFVVGYDLAGDWLVHSVGG